MVSMLETLDAKFQVSYSITGILRLADKSTATNNTKPAYAGSFSIQARESLDFYG
jgi:hypothetical protein